MKKSFLQTWGKEMTQEQFERNLYLQQKFTDLIAPGGLGQVYIKNSKRAYLLGTFDESIVNLHSYFTTLKLYNIKN